MLPLALALAAGLTATAPPAPPIALHPDNPRYFLFRGKPAVLITSAEHYGAVLNGDFDFLPYLKELGARGLNLTRAFSGAYCEAPGDFKIQHNTLAPLPGRLVAPWARSDTPGYAGGGMKFDLTRWNDAYFRRLKEFVRQAGERGVVVELVLFCPFYEDSMWNLSPMNAANNINGVGPVPREEVYSLKHAALTEVQDALVRKLASELAEYDNLYYEICNEAYFGGVTAGWQRHISQTLAQAEAALPARHLIAQNIANGAARVQDPDPNVSIFNFHYANPPDAVALNEALKRPIGFDETGFRGTADLPYRADGWEFILAGGAVYDNLDYSFTADHPDGTEPVVAPTPGGGGPSLRRQLQILKEFIGGFDFLRMRPDGSVVQGGVPAGATARTLSEPGQAYAVYLRGGAQATLTLDLPAGRYRADWVNPRTGAVDRGEDLDHAGGRRDMASPPYSEDIALRVRRAGTQAS
jgi:hypothetical protein